MGSETTAPGVAHLQQVSFLELMLLLHLFQAP